MGPQGGREGAALTEQLLAEPHKFDFFQAVRLLERARGGAGAPVGGDASPVDEPVQFRSRPSLSFPGAPVLALQPPPPGPPDDSPHAPPGRYEMPVSFIGLTGPSGVLPHHYTATLIQQVHDKNTAIWDFLDAFNHRLVSLFYRAWEKYRVPAAYERASASGAADPFTRSVLCLIGMGTDGLTGRSEVVDEALAHYSGLFARHPRSAAALEAILADYFDVPAAVEQFQGQWLRIPDEDRTSLPARRDRGPAVVGGRNNQLGATAVLGASVWDASSKFRVRLGPLTYDQYHAFLPDGQALAALFQLARLYVGPELDFDVQLVLMAAEVPPLGLTSASPRPPRLGRNAWLASRPFEHDFSEGIFNLEAS